MRSRSIPPAIAKRPSLYVVNGVTTNNLTFGSIGFPPPVASIQEFKVDNSTFSAEFGHVSGAVVNLVTRSGTDRFRGEAYEFFRNDALDARNFFELTSPDPHRFERNQFGGSAGGPLIRGRAFFFATYEGLRQRQGVDLNSLVLSDAQRAAATDPVIRQLLPLIPRANFFDADGTPRFVGSGDASVDENTWTVDGRYNAGSRDRVQVFYGRQQVDGVEPAGGGTSIPGFGQKRAIWKSTLTVSETHTFGPGLLNEARFGQTMQDGSTLPAAALNPADFGIANGVTRPIGLPQIVVAGSLNFGGPALLPQGRKDTLYLFNDTVTYVTGRHSMRFGGEFRRFLNDNFAEGTGQFNFPTVAAFLSGTANAFSITLGERLSHITQDALAFFAQDRIAIGSNLTLDLGLRYEWHVTPTERDDQFVVFDAASAALVRVGLDVDRIYRQNNTNVEPRLGFAWTPSADGRTVVRGAYGWAVDQPSTTVVRDTPGNPPFATPLSASGAIPLASAVSLTRPIGLAPVTVDPRVPECLAAILERQRAAAARARSRRSRRIFRLQRQRSANLTQYQPAGGRRPAVSIGFAIESDTSGCAARQHHAGREHRLLQLSRAVGVGDEAAVGRPDVRRVVHVVEVARHQFAELVRLRRSGQLRHSQSVPACPISTPGTGS